MGIPGLLAIGSSRHPRTAKQPARQQPSIAKQHPANRMRRTSMLLRATTVGYGKGGGRGDKSKEFILVNPRNIDIAIATGKSFDTNPYLPFNNAFRRLIMAQGADGDRLLGVLDKIEKMGSATLINDMLREPTTKYSNAEEFDRAVRAALLNCSSGIAKGLVQYNVANGSDAWRKLYHRYIPLASYLQDVLIREFYDPKPVSENDIDSLFDEVARIRDLYTKAGPADDLSERWIKSVVLRHLPK